MKFISYIAKTYKKRKFQEDQLNSLRHYKTEIFTEVHVTDIDELCKQLSTNKITGLKSEHAKYILAINGPNELTPYKGKPEYLKLLYALFHGSSLLLWFGTILSFMSAIVVYSTYHFYDYDDILLGTMLIVIIFLTSLFSFFQERRGSKIMESFKNMIPLYSTVIRDGKKVSVVSRDLVVGDLVELKSGDRIPADVRITETNNFKVDNSPITGESQAVYLTTQYTNDNFSETKNIAFFSTSVVEGNGKGIVVFCGDNTVMGRVAGLSARIQPNKTPIAKELDYFMQYTAIWAGVLGILFGILAYSIGYTWLEALLFLIGIIVANVPEGLIATVTVSLAITAKKMAKKNCLVKNLEVVETLGTTSVICSDKTGTLTQNKMIVAHIWLNNTMFDVDFKNNLNQNEYKNCKGFQELIRCATLCSTAEFAPNQSDVSIENRTVFGDASEAAILKFIETNGIKCKVYQQSCPKLVEKPFSSIHKYQMSVHSVNDRNCILVLKGAPEQVLERCTTILFENKFIPLTEDLKDICEKSCILLAENGERVLGFCDLVLDKMYSRSYPFQVIPTPNFPDTGLRFLGFISMMDPPRPQVYAAIAACKNAGIQIIMITGDHPVTAKSIARQVGIITDHSRTSESTPLLRQSQSVIVPGSELRTMSNDSLEDLLSSYMEIVFARVTPTQKLQVVEACQRLDKIVAVTGDGVNDSPALKKADIGIAMGLCGSQVSHQSADIILLDDNFSSIIMGIEEGRKIYENMKKAIAYILTSNVAQITPYIAFAVLNIPLPLGITAVLCIDLLTDMLPAISLAYENAESNIMSQIPRNSKKDMLVTCRMYFYAYGHMGVIESVAGFFVYFMVMAENGFMPRRLLGLREEWENPLKNSVVDSYGQEWTYQSRKILEYTCSSAYMVSVVVTQLANVIVCKTRYTSIKVHRMRNHFLHISIFLEIVITCALIYLPGMKYLKLYPVKWNWWCYSLPFAIFMIVFDEWRKWNLRKPKHHPYFDATNY